MAKNKSGGSPFFTGMDSFGVEQEDNQAVTSAPAVPTVSQVVAPVLAAPAASPAVTASQVQRSRFRKAPQEKRSARMNLLVKPSTVDGLKAIAERDYRSMNDIVNEVLEKYIQENS